MRVKASAALPALAMRAGSASGPRIQNSLDPISTRPVAQPSATALRSAGGACAITMSTCRSCSSFMAWPEPALNQRMVAWWLCANSVGQAYLRHPVPSWPSARPTCARCSASCARTRNALCDAISADYGHRSRHETLLAEIFPALDGIDHASSTCAAG
jgi:hypothetical protein